MIDYFFRWASEAAAKADALMLADFLNVAPGDLREWARDCVLPNVKAWRPSQDIDGVHTYITGWMAIVSVNRHVSVLLNASALAFALDRDAALRDEPFVVKNNVGTLIKDIAVEPIFCGSDYPIGNYPDQIMTSPEFVPSMPVIGSPQLQVF